ncbi:hypothetical protein Pst134EA_032702 [Puccinia striiformis f. sp. tritici]|uniref:uncharacterized protein n=1 Tax=Puccinia striiformis f. sp. tritici TaxID=168172 RepID=UPI002007708E|nr:uncharacterized protein Pst134EA_032702 [Puccinia striiformis f. sp. tritici]KAH9443460.1 hypothetical protein Pst134EA_032702 [Puccinia striiformis f. sp. tritici]
MRSQFVLTIFIASACCIVLTPKLEVEGSGPIALDGLVSSASSDEPKSTSINRDQSLLKRKTIFWPDAREEAEYPFRKEFTDLIKDSPFKDLHPKKRQFSIVEILGKKLLVNWLFGVITESV